MEYENGLKKFTPVCKLKILECLADTGRHRFGLSFDKFRKISKNTLR